MGGGRCKNRERRHQEGSPETPGNPVTPEGLQEAHCIPLTIGSHLSQEGPGASPVLRRPGMWQMFNQHRGQELSTERNHRAWALSSLALMAPYLLGAGLAMPQLPEPADQVAPTGLLLGNKPSVGWGVRREGQIQFPAPLPQGVRAWKPASGVAPRDPRLLLVQPGVVPAHMDHSWSVWLVKCSRQKGIPLPSSGYLMDLSFQLGRTHIHPLDLSLHPPITSPWGSEPPRHAVSTPRQSTETHVA